MKLEITGIKAVGIRKSPAEYLSLAVCSLQTRFWQRVGGVADECWFWTGGRNWNGYGRIVYAGKVYTAHRMSWILCFGPIKFGLWVLHRCDAPLCVNPTHLFLGNSKDNIRDMVRKGRDNFDGKNKTIHSKSLGVAL